MVAKWAKDILVNDSVSKGWAGEGEAEARAGWVAGSRQAGPFKLKVCGSIPTVSCIENKIIYAWKEGTLVFKIDLSVYMAFACGAASFVRKAFSWLKLSSSCNLLESP